MKLAAVTYERAAELCLDGELDAMSDLLELANDETSRAVRLLGG